MSDDQKRGPVIPFGPGVEHRPSRPGDPAGSARIAVPSPDHAVGMEERLVVAYGAGGSDGRSGMVRLTSVATEPLPGGGTRTLYNAHDLPDEVPVHVGTGPGDPTTFGGLVFDAGGRGGQTPGAAGEPGKVVTVDGHGLVRRYDAAGVEVHASPPDGMTAQRFFDEREAGQLEAAVAEVAAALAEWDRDPGDDAVEAFVDRVRAALDGQKKGR